MSKKKDLIQSQFESFIRVKSDLTESLEHASLLARQLGEEAIAKNLLHISDQIWKLSFLDKRYPEIVTSLKGRSRGRTI